MCTQNYSGIYLLSDIFGRCSLIYSHRDWLAGTRVSYSVNNIAAADALAKQGVGLPAAMVFHSRYGKSWIQISDFQCVLYGIVYFAPNLIEICSPWSNWHQIVALIQVMAWHQIGDMLFSCTVWNCILLQITIVMNVLVHTPIFSLFQWTHDIMIALLLRQNDVATSFWRNDYVIITSCVRRADVRSTRPDACAANQTIMTPSNGNLSALLALWAGNSPATGEGETKASADAELWCFLWSASWINVWVNNCEAGDLRRHRAHYDVTVIQISSVDRGRCGVISSSFLYSYKLLFMDTTTLNKTFDIFPCMASYVEMYMLINTSHHSQTWCKPECFCCALRNTDLFCFVWDYYSSLRFCPVGLPCNALVCSGCMQCYDIRHAMLLVGSYKHEPYLVCSMY